jgi:hypothetical protein
VDVVKWEAGKKGRQRRQRPSGGDVFGRTLHERLGRLAPIAGQKMAAAAADPDLHPAGGSGNGSEPKILNDNQMKDVMNPPNMTYMS